MIIRERHLNCMSGYPILRDMSALVRATYAIATGILYAFGTLYQWARYKEEDRQFDYSFELRQSFSHAVRSAFDIAPLVMFIYFTYVVTINRYGMKERIDDLLRGNFERALPSMEDVFDFGYRNITGIPSIASALYFGNYWKTLKKTVNLFSGGDYKLYTSKYLLQDFLQTHPLPSYLIVSTLFSAAYRYYDYEKDRHCCHEQKCAKAFKWHNHPSKNITNRKLIGIFDGGWPIRFYPKRRNFDFSVRIYDDRNPARPPYENPGEGRESAQMVDGVHMVSRKGAKVDTQAYLNR